MPRVSLAFYLVAALFGLAGMLLGMQMGMTQDFKLTPVHAHLNLLGWATLALMGTFYALIGAARPVKLSWINFGLSSIGALGMTVGLAIYLSGGEGMTLTKLGALTAILGMVSFVVAVVKVFLKNAPA